MIYGCTLEMRKELGQLDFWDKLIIFFFRRDLLRETPGNFTFKKLTYKGIPITFKKDVPEDKVYFIQKNGNWIKRTVKARRYGKLRKVKK